MNAEGASMVPLEFHQVVSNQLFETLNLLARDKLNSLNEYFRSNPVTDFGTYCEFVLSGSHFGAMPAIYRFTARIGLLPTCVSPPPTEEEMLRARQMQADRQEELQALMTEQQLDAIVLGSTRRRLLPISYGWEGFPESCENASQLEDEENQLTAVSSVSGFPVLTVPAGLAQDGHPVSIQVMGRPFDEPYLISLAQSFADAYPQHTGTSNRSLPASTPLFLDACSLPTPSGWTDSQMPQGKPQPWQPVESGSSLCVAVSVSRRPVAHRRGCEDHGRTLCSPTQEERAFDDQDVSAKLEESAIPFL